MVTKIIDTTCIRKGLKKRLTVTQAQKLVSKCAKKKRNEMAYAVKYKSEGKWHYHSKRYQPGNPILFKTRKSAIKNIRTKHRLTYQITPIRVVKYKKKR